MPPNSTYCWHLNLNQLHCIISKIFFSNANEYRLLYACEHMICSIKIVRLTFIALIYVIELTYFLLRTMVLHVLSLFICITLTYMPFDDCVLYFLSGLACSMLCIKFLNSCNNCDQTSSCLWKTNLFFFSNV